MLITLYKIGKLHFRLLGTNGFHVKVKSERFTSASSRCRQNLEYENFTSSFGRLSLLCGVVVAVLSSKEGILASTTGTTTP